MMMYCTRLQSSATVKLAPNCDVEPRGTSLAQDNGHAAVTWQWRVYFVISRVMTHTTLHVVNVHSVHT